MAHTEWLVMNRTCRFFSYFTKHISSDKPWLLTGNIGRATRTSSHPVMTSTGLSVSSTLAKTPGTPQCIFIIVLTSITLAQH